MAKVIKEFVGTDKRSYRIEKSEDFKIALVQVYNRESSLYCNRDAILAEAKILALDVNGLNADSSVYVGRNLVMIFDKQLSDEWRGFNESRLAESLAR